MATLFLIRHAVTAQTGRLLYGQTPGVDLDDRGRAQAAGLVERFSSIKLTAIYSSPLERCVQTVEPLADAQRLSIAAVPDLIEMDAGSWTGRTLAQVRRTKHWKTVQQQPSAFRFPAGEGFLERIRRHVKQLAFPVPAEKTLICYAKLGSDAGFIGAAACGRLLFKSLPAGSSEPRP